MPQVAPNGACGGLQIQNYKQVAPNGAGLHASSSF